MKNTKKMDFTKEKYQKMKVLDGFRWF